MNNKKLSVIFSVFIIVAFAVGAFVYNDRKADFDFAEKNTFAMGTIVSQKVYAANGKAYTDSITQLIIDLENTISRKKESSPVSVLNETGEIESSEIHDILLSCEEIKQQSGGAFDITVGKLSDEWGFDEEKHIVPEKEKIEKLVSDMQKATLSFDQGKVRFDGNASVDLGAVGKGLACDKAIAFCKAVKDCRGAIISVGGSIGCFGSQNKAGDKWRIAIRHPRNESEYLGVVSLNEGFVSTSGDYEKYFTDGDTRYHHILDARTGYPALSDFISVTVVCDNGFLSDALSTACFIAGSENWESLLEKYEASAVAVTEDGEIITYGDIDFEKG